MATNSNTRVERKLCAILAADIVGYSDHMNRDEVGTFHALRQCRDVVDPIISDYGGRTFFTAGDSVVAEFPSAGNCVLCAQEMQNAIDVRNDNPHDGPEMVFRIGLNVGDVVITGDDLIGGGVNIAARLEALAEPGGVYLSGSVYDQIAQDTTVTDLLVIEEIGLKELKNIPEPIRVYRLIKSRHSVPIVADLQGKEQSPPEIGALQMDTPNGPMMLVIGTELAIGREVGGEPVAVSVTNPRVSRVGRQARIDYQDGTFTITDLDSSNGTFLNDDLLLPQQAHALVYHDGRCEISVGGGREPPRKGLCRFIVDAIEAPDPVLRISLSRSILNKPEISSIVKTWTGLLEEVSKTWVLSAGRILVGGDLDCGVHLPGTTAEGFKVAVERLQGQYSLSSIGPAEAILNGTPFKEKRAVTQGDVLTLGEVSITIGTIP